jgi:hypothetical protein
MENDDYISALKRRFPPLQNAKNDQAAKGLIHAMMRMTPEQLDLLAEGMRLVAENGWTVQEGIYWAWDQDRKRRGYRDDD